MKFVSVHPAEDTYTFEDADRLAAFARKHGMKMRGHTLVWHNQTTDWLFEDKNGNLVDKATLYERLKSHTDTVVKRYKGDIYAWDVVNEVIADEGAELLRPSKWLDIAGPEFISKAFEYAHEADPAALLFYNDYNESHPHKRDKIHTLVKSALDQGTPIHGMDCRHTGICTIRLLMISAPRSRNMHRSACDFNSPSSMCRCSGLKTSGRI